MAQRRYNPSQGIIDILDAASNLLALPVPRKQEKPVSRNTLFFQQMAWRAMAIGARRGRLARAAKLATPLHDVTGKRLTQEADAA